jgi:hypothetical protein
MNAAANYEGAGADAAHDCLDAILNSADQAEACRAVIKMMGSLSGDGEIAKQARCGAAVALVNVIERGLGAISADGGE